MNHEKKAKLECGNKDKTNGRQTDGLLRVTLDPSLPMAGFKFGNQDIQIPFLNFKALKK